MLVSKPEIKSYFLRIEREKLERLEEIAKTEHRTLPLQLRKLVDDCIAAHDHEAAA